MGFCRYDHSEQLFTLELLLKMRSYSSGNRRNFGKMSGFEEKCVILLPELIFQLSFFGVKYSPILLNLRKSLLKGAKIPDILPKILRFPDE